MLTEKIVPYLKETKGNIINTGSSLTQATVNYSYSDQHNVMTLFLGYFFTSLCLHHDQIDDRHVHPKSIRYIETFWYQSQFRSPRTR